MRPDNELESSFTRRVEDMKTGPAFILVFASVFVLGGCAGAPKVTAAPEPTGAERGMEVYDRVIEIGGLNEACSNCHRLDSGQTSGPSFQGLAARAEGRSGELSAEEYLRQSIIDPSAYVAEGSFIFEMPEGYEDVLSEAEINDLIAFMMTK